MYITKIDERKKNQPLVISVPNKNGENISIIHNRQPVILNEIDINKYLNIEINGSSFLQSAKKPSLEFYEISKEVNKPTNNNISLIQRII